MVKAGAEALITNEPALTEWDSVAGDGDCGITMKRGGCAPSSVLPKGGGGRGGLSMRIDALLLHYATASPRAACRKEHAWNAGCGGIHNCTSVIFSLCIYFIQGRLEC